MHGWNQIWGDASIVFIARTASLRCACASALISMFLYILAAQRAFDLQMSAHELVVDRVKASVFSRFGVAADLVCRFRPPPRSVVAAMS
mmetsp:Transcript_100547/g.324324  ORF Transcript_100547/g.324324 Transcript_100547/m.324324 type:complete len:89 (+) Transcript_100547:230-496(+)